MRFIVSFAESRRANMRVDLSCHQTLMAEQLLDTPNIRPAIQQVRGKAMAQGMR